MSYNDARTVVIYNEFIKNDGTPVYTEASAIGLEPGEWPDKLRDEGYKIWTLESFEYQGRGSDREIESALYFTPDDFGGQIMRLFND